MVAMQWVEMDSNLRLSGYNENDNRNNRLPINGFRKLLLAHLPPLLEIAAALSCN